MSDILRPEELALIAANQQRCDACGHLVMLHIQDDDGPTTCGIDGCDCIDYMNAKQRDEQQRRLDEARRQQRENQEAAAAFLRRMQLDSRYPGRKILWAHSPGVEINGMIEVVWLRGLPAGDCVMVVTKGTREVSFPTMTSAGFGSVSMRRTEKTHDGMAVFE